MGILLQQMTLPMDIPLCNYLPILFLRRIVFSAAYHTPNPKIGEPSARITEDAYTASYKVAKESTFSSLSGRHIGHYKAILP